MRFAGSKSFLYLLFLVPACAHYEARPTPEPPREAMMAQTVEGIRLTASRPEESYGAFEADLQGNGIFPLLLYYQNDSALSVQAARRDIVLSSRGGGCRQLAVGDVSERIGFSPAGRYFAWSYGLFGIGIIPGTIDHFKAEEANRAISQDLVAKELRDVTLAPSEKAQGFVFFECPNNSRPTELREALSAADGRLLRFTIEFPDIR